MKIHFPLLADQLLLINDRSDESSMFTKFYKYDMFLGEKIIEYNGDYWHANPTKYNETFVSRHTGETQKQILDNDADKLRVATENGYIVKIVWESAYKYNKNKVIEECIQFLKP